MVYDVAMRPPHILALSVSLAALAAAAQGLVLFNDSGSTDSVGRAMITRFIFAFLFAAFGMAVARASNLRGSILATSEDGKQMIRDFINLGVLPGLVLGLFNYLFFFAYRYSPFVHPRFLTMSSYYDSFIVSLDAGLSEEMVFRLFFLSGFVFLFRHLQVRYRPRASYAAHRTLPMVSALIISSYLFALVHDTYAFGAAFFGGLILGTVFAKGGIESAIAAHFCADFLFYSASYLS